MRDQQQSIQISTTKMVTDVCLMAGKILMESGAETYRVEDTMTRIAATAGFSHTDSFVTPTGIIFSLDGENPTRLVRINNRTTDLEKVARVNDISRKIAENKLSFADAHELLSELKQNNDSFPIWLQIFAASLASGCFLMMFRGHWIDFLPATIVGGLGFASLLMIHHFTNVKFFAEFIASFVIGVFAMIAVQFELGDQLDKIIIGSVMPLVPGLLITNAVRDLMAGHFVSGLSKGAEAFLTAFAIGAGVAIVFSIFI